MGLCPVTWKLLILCTLSFSFSAWEPLNKVPRVLTGALQVLTNWICQVRPYKSLYLHHGPYKSS